MTELEIELEIQKRVEFKLNDIESTLKALVNYYEHKAWVESDQMESIKSDIIKHINEIVEKEKNMPLPHNRMFADDVKDIKNKTVEILENRLVKKGAANNLNDIIFINDTITRMLEQIFSLKI